VKKSLNYLILHLLLTLALLSLLEGTCLSMDVENCLLCHKYRGLSYIDEDHQLRLLYIAEPLYLNSPHGRLECRSCHADVGEFPHKKAQRIDCLTECHLEEPTTGKAFSHKDVGKVLETSVHATKDPEGNPKEFSEDIPDCKTCHNDPLYRPIALFKKVRQGISEKIIGRCLVCHEDQTFVRKFYSHFSSRMQKVRSPKGVVEMCARCHEDADLMERHDLPNVVHSYLETYHGKAVYYEDEESPDCLDCHITPGESIHAMQPKDDQKSAVHVSQRSKTCSQIDCHMGSDEKLAGFKPHVIADRKRHPIEYYVSAFFVTLTLGSFVPLMVMTILDIGRKLFPDFCLIKRKGKDR
jgi:hypothetical protein